MTILYRIGSLRTRFWYASTTIRRSSEKRKPSPLPSGHCAYDDEIVVSLSPPLDISPIRMARLNMLGVEDPPITYSFEVASVLHGWYTFVNKKKMPFCSDARALDMPHACKQALARHVTSQESFNLPLNPDI